MESTAPQPIARRCKDCGQTFRIIAEELAWWRELAKRAEHVRLPSRCTDCRFARRRAREAIHDNGVDEWLVCLDCGASFVFGGYDKSYFASRGWATPKRCRPCRLARQGHSR